MGDILVALATTPLPTVLALGGMVFIFLAIVPVKVKILGNPSPKRQVVSGLVGVILLLGGISLYLPAMDGPEVVNTPTAMANEVALPSPVEEHVSPTPAAEETPQEEPSTIAVTEVMASPCVDVVGASVNEFIEIYNFGPEPVDVSGWWLASNTRGDGDVPDKVVAWTARNPNIPLNTNAILDTSVIPPSGYAVILSPEYHRGDGKYVMPYRFPEDTIILTIGNGDCLGNETSGLLGKTNPLSVVVLYKGTEFLIEEVVSTYGTPVVGLSPYEIRNDEDDLPVMIGDCHSAERIDIFKPDSESNWRTTSVISPGWGTYGH